MADSKIDRLMVVVDGRVFSTDAHDRGMGRYVRFLIQTISLAGYDICLILYTESRLKIEDPLRSLCKKIETIELDPATYKENDIHPCSYEIERIIKGCHAVTFLDATPFILPMRLDITVCPVIAVAYDLIPLRYPKEYIPNEYSGVADFYQNGLRRLAKADFLIAISHYSKDMVSNYLGIERDRIEVIYPSLDQDYLSDTSLQHKAIDFFAILGGHLSKHPRFALELYNQLNTSRRREHTICVPTRSQLCVLKSEFPSLTKGLLIKSSLDEEEKSRNQAQAKVVFHLSVDEGFGIPLLEALFKHTRVVCCDIRINREILEAAGDGCKEIALLVSTNAKENSLSEIEEFIDKPEAKENEQYFKRIKEYFCVHWTKEAPNIIKKAIRAASEIHADFLENIIAKMVSNTPKDFCGVADYAYSIPFGTKKNIIVYTADAPIKKINPSSHVRLKSHLCFKDDLENRMQTIFHLAVSQSLLFGIELMRLYGSSNDIVIMHDHTYLYGLYHFHFHYGKISDFLERYFIGCDSKFKKGVDKPKYMSIYEFSDAVSGYQSSWLHQTNMKLISHLTVEAENEYEFLGNKPILFNKQNVEIGIDDRASSITLRIAEAWRIEKGFSNFDFVVGIFGSVTDNKYVSEISSAIAKACKQLRAKPGRERLGIHFVICGFIHDHSVFKKAKASFESKGLGSFFHYENPSSDQQFDGIIAASDIVISCRKQDRGQFSHIIPRALCLGRPVLSNSKSGYSMIQHDCMIDDVNFESKLHRRVLYFFENREELQSISRINRSLFMEKYNITSFFHKAVKSCESS